MVEILGDLLADDSAPYLECAACCTCKGLVESEAMVLWPTNLLSASRQTIDDLLGHDCLTLLSPADLKNGKTYSRLLLAGPFCWFDRHSSHVLTAPKAPEIVSLSYDWLPDYWGLGNAFTESEECGEESQASYASVHCPTLEPRGDVVLLDDEEVLPTLPVLVTSARHDHESDEDEDPFGSEPVPHPRVSVGAEEPTCG